MSNRSGRYLSIYVPQHDLQLIEQIDQIAKRDRRSRNEVIISLLGSSVKTARDIALRDELAAGLPDEFPDGKLVQRP